MTVSSQQRCAAEGVGGIDFAGAVSGDVDLEVAGQAEQVERAAARFGQDHNVCPTPAEISKVAVNVVR